MPKSMYMFICTRARLTKDLLKLEIPSMISHAQVNVHVYTVRTQGQGSPKTLSSTRVTISGFTCPSQYTCSCTHTRARLTKDYYHLSSSGFNSLRARKQHSKYLAHTTKVRTLYTRKVAAPHLPTKARRKLCKFSTVLLWEPFSRQTQFVFQDTPRGGIVPTYPIGI